MQSETEGLAVADKPTHGGARKGAGRPKGERPDKAVKMDRSLADMAYVIAKYRGITIAKYLTDTFRAAILRDYAKVVHDVGKRQEE
jgi:hypothetical protein